jgi:hypothetical protein
MIYDWRRTRRAGVELNGASETVPISVSATTAGGALSLALVILASVTRRRPASSSSVEVPTSLPLSLPQSPHFMLDATVDLEPISSSA